MSLSKNSKIFFNIFILSPPLIVQVLYEFFEISIFKVLIAFKEVNDKVKVFNGIIVGGGYCCGTYIYAPISP